MKPLDGPVIAAAVLCTTLIVGAGRAHAGCNLIPGAERTFNGQLGATNRPFAAPGERLEVALRTCDGDSPGLSAVASDQLVTVVFTPPTGARNAVVLTADGDCSAVAPLLGACQSALTGGGTATCVAGTEAGLQIIERNGVRRLSFRFPDTDPQCIGGSNAGRPCFEASDCPGGTCDPNENNFTLAGSASIAVTRRNLALPCGLATASCAAQTDLVACIDDYFANDGACGTAVPNATFPHFTALPPPNNYAADCFSEGPPPDGPCVLNATELRFALDSEGNLLLPMGWQGILVPSSIPVPRLLRTTFSVPSFVGSFSIPDQVFLASFSPEGGKLPPIFEPQLTPEALPDVVTLFGSVDAPYTILRIGRRFGMCNAGDNDNQPCNTNLDCPFGVCETACVDAPATSCANDGDCPSGSCGVLFDLGTLALPGGTLALPRPVVDNGICQETVLQSPLLGCSADCGVNGPCVNYALEAQTPVVLASLAVQTDDVRSFVMSEALDLQDRNGDGDQFDTVITLRNRSTGAGDNLGAPSGCAIAGDPEGRAVVSISESPYRFPAVAVEDDVLQFLESEVGQKRCIINGDEDLGDVLLRVFRLGVGETSISPLRGVDAAPRINGRSAVVSAGRVFFRSAEAAMARRLTRRVSVGPAALEADGGSNTPSFSAVSADGRYIVFVSDATNLLGPGGDTNGFADIFLHDLESGSTVRVHEDAGGTPADDDALPDAYISPDGRYVGFSSDATNLLGPGGDTNSVADVYLRDRCLVNGDAVLGCMPTIERVSLGVGAAAGNNDSYRFSISADGRFVAFSSDATNLLGPGVDTNGVTDIFLRDRCVADGLPVGSCAATTVRVSVAPGGSESDGNSDVAFVSADGRYVAFTSDATNLLGVGIDTNGVADVFVHDRCIANGVSVAGCTVTNERVSEGPGGTQANSASSTTAFSSDARLVVFESDASNLLGAGVDTNGVPDVFVRDRQTGVLERLSVGPAGLEGDNFSGGGALSPDGRFVAFVSQASNLLGPGGDTNGAIDVYLHDRRTGSTERVSVGPGPLEGDGPSIVPSVSNEGRVVAFTSAATNMLGSGNDDNFSTDVFVRATDPADPLGIDNLLFDDNRLDDVVLEVANATSGAVTTLCPAEDVAVAAGNAAFLRPESVAGTPGCPGGSLNPTDSDTDDRVVQLWTGGAVLDLDRPATAVRLSSSYLAALVDEAADGNTPHNGDGLADDTVVQIHPVGPGAWSNTGLVGQAADTLELSGSIVAFITPEAAQNASLINADSDPNDRVLQVYNADTSTLVLSASSTPRAVAAEDFVLGEPAACGLVPVQLVAWRAAETAQGNTSLNTISNGQPTGDTDTADTVLHVYDVVSGTLVNVGQAVTPCALDACDPRQPYRVNGTSVKFLTLEPEQGGQDLSANGITTDLVLQVFDFCADRVTVIGPVAPTGQSQNPLDEPDDSRAFVSEGGRCDVGQSCDPDDDQCPEGAYCEADTCDTGAALCTVHQTLPCTSDADCSRCVLRNPPTCVVDGDCPAGATCGAQLITSVTGVADSDDDGVPDDQDNCPALPNPTQDDGDNDRVGNACDEADALALLPGAKLLVKDKDGNPDKRKIVLKASNDPGIVTGLIGTGADPTVGGGMVTLYNPTTMETGTITLPAIHWQGLGNPPGSGGYKYNDQELADGPCKRVIIKPGKLLKVLCKGPQINFTLDEPSQGSLAIKVASGGAGSQSYCLHFASGISADTPAVNGATGTFNAKDAAAPPNCPVP